MIVLDTNVVSELMHLAPHADVMEWMSAQDFDDVFVTAISVGELWFGVDSLPVGRRRDDLDARVGRVLASFGPTFIPFDSAAARIYGTVAARHPGMDTLDAQIAAIAIAHGASLATRNIKHFEPVGVGLVDPWSA